MQTSVEVPRVEFLENPVKGLFIGGEFVDSYSGHAIESVNPANGEVIAELADGEEADISRAVKAARAAFEGPWSKFKPTERQNVLLRLAEVVERHYDELALLDTLDMGVPLKRGVLLKDRVLESLRYNAGWATKLHGETISNSLSGQPFEFHP